MKSSRNAIKLAQTMLNSAVDAELRVDGVWGAETERAWKRATATVQSMIRDSVRVHEGVEVDNLRVYVRPKSAVALKKVNNAVTTPTGADASRPALAGSTGSGWEGRLTSKLLAAGVPVGNIPVITKQVKKESGGNFKITEQTYAGAKGHDFLRKNVRAFRDWSDKQINDLRAKGERAFFSYMYANRMGHGGAESGDGYKYRGRGPLQLTGKNNYAAVGKVLGVDLVSDPDWVVRSDDNGVASAIAFLRVNHRLTTPMTAAQMAKLTNPSLA